MKGTISTFETLPPLLHSSGDIRLPLDHRASSRGASCATLLQSVEAPRGSPEFPPLPWCRAPVSDPGGVSEARASAAPAIGPSVLLTTAAPTLHVHNGAQALHAGALRSITSLCPLRRRRYRLRRNTRYPVPGQGFRGQDLPPRVHTVTRSRPQGESNGEHQADLPPGGVLSPRPGKPIAPLRATRVRRCYAATGPNTGK